MAKSVFSECKPVFLTKTNEDTDDYHQGWKKQTVPQLNQAFGSPWRYLSAKESNTDYTVWGRTQNSFGGGGYIAYLGSDWQGTLELINSLKADRWIDGLTRVVFLEFSIYNANVNILSAVVFSIEFSSFGGSLPRVDMYLFRLYRYFTPLQFLYLVAEILFVIFVAQLIYRVGCLIYRDQWSYFTSLWNLTDIFLILFSLVTIALYAVRESHLNSAIKAIRENPDTFYGFLTVAFYDDYIAYFSCLIVLIPTVQFLKFLKFNKSFMIFYSTLERIRGNISGFAFVFFVSLMCFTYWAYSMLKTVAESFSTFTGTFYSMIAMLLGKFSFRLLSPGQAVTAEVGPIFTYTFTCANVFFILNIILTIITIGFKESREDERFQQSEYEIIKFIVTSIKGACGLLPPYIPPAPRIEPPAQEKHFTYFQWKLCTSYVTRSQFPRLLNFANDAYLEDFVDELELVANLLSMPQSRRLLYEITRREQGF